MRAPRSRRGLWLAGLLVALLIAGVGSWYASSSPDGLEWAAQHTGFARTAQDSAAAGSPLAGYTVAGAGQDRVSSGLAGVIGVTVTLLLAGGVTMLVRRRGGPEAPEAGD